MQKCARNRTTNKKNSRFEETMGYLWHLKLKHRKEQEMILSGRFDDPYGRAGEREIGAVSGRLSNNPGELALLQKSSSGLKKPKWQRWVSLKIAYYEISIRKRILYRLQEKKEYGFLFQNSLVLLIVSKMRIFPYATLLAFIIVLRYGFDIWRTFLVKSKINKYAA